MSGRRVGLHEAACGAAGPESPPPALQRVKKTVQGLQIDATRWVMCVLSRKAAVVCLKPELNMCMLAIAFSHTRYLELGTRAAGLSGRRVHRST